MAGMAVEHSYTSDIRGDLPLIQHADLEGKIVLVRVDHNVVSKGRIQDQYRVDQTLSTIYNLVERGGRPILMTHIGRPYDKKTKTIRCEAADSVDTVVEYLHRKLKIKFAIPDFVPHGTQGIEDIDTSINHLLHDLRNKRIGGIYLPNTRWFAGEEAKGERAERFAIQLAGLADVFVNDAFGSWQPHASTYHITKHLPSYAGLLMQDELAHSRQILAPERPFVAVVAGSKYDTKIGPLKEIYKKVDSLILGGVIYNAYLCAKYGVKIKGVDEADVELAKALVEQDKVEKKLVELPFLVESDTLEGKVEGRFRTISTADFAPGKEYNYILDADPSSFDDASVSQAFDGAKTIFVNAVMGFTPHFSEGTTKLDVTIDKNTSAFKFLGGGDTLYEFKKLLPGLYHAAIDSSKYYLFTGGGTVLKVIEEGDPYGLEPVKALVENAARFGTIKKQQESPKLSNGYAKMANGYHFPGQMIQQIKQASPVSVSA